MTSIAKTLQSTEHQRHVAQQDEPEKAAPMSGNRRPPRVRDRLLGAQLREIRKQRTDLSLERLAEKTDLSLATLSRIENGLRRIGSVDVAILLTAYDAPAAVRTKLIRLACEGGQDGIWQVHDGVGHGGILQLESSAFRLTEWQVGSVPPLLQTPAFAAQQCAASTPPHELQVRLDRLRRRQQALGHLEYTAFIHESLVQAQLARRPVYREQIAHLIDAIDRGIGVRLVRHSTPPHQVSAHPWVLMEFPNDPPIVHLRLQRVSVYLDQPESDAYESLRTQLTHIACTSQDSQRYLKHLLTSAD